MLDIDYDFYKEQYGGLLSQDTVSPLLNSAAIIIENLCGDRLTSDNQLFSLKFAACIQADYMSGNDLSVYASEESTDEQSSLSSVKLGDFSAEFSSGGQSTYGTQTSSADEISPHAIMLLSKRGLMFRGGVIA